MTTPHANHPVHRVLENQSVPWCASASTKLIREFDDCGQHKHEADAGQEKKPTSRAKSFEATDSKASCKCAYFLVLLKVTDTACILGTNTVFLNVASEIVLRTWALHSSSNMIMMPNFEFLFASTTLLRCQSLHLLLPESRSPRRVNKTTLTWSNNLQKCAIRNLGMLVSSASASVLASVNRRNLGGN